MEDLFVSKENASVIKCHCAPILVLFKVLKDLENQLLFHLTTNLSVLCCVTEIYFSSVFFSCIKPYEMQAREGCTKY